MCCIVELSRVADCRPSLPVVVSEETTSSHEDTCWILAACYNLMGCFMECFSGHYTLLSLCLSPLGLAVVWRIELIVFGRLPFVCLGASPPQIFQKRCCIFSASLREDTSEDIS